MERVILWYGMLFYAILCYSMVWKVWYAMRFQWYAMIYLCMLCYAIAYVVKDKQSATVQDVKMNQNTTLRCLRL